MLPSGKTNEARGVAHTMMDAIRLMRKVSPKAIHQTLRPRRCRPRDFQPSLEYPSRVTTSSMTNAATIGVHIHTEPIVEARPSTLIDKAAPTASKSTRTEKTAPLVVSVSLANILKASYI